jgi:nickel-dependent lactate racemase
MDDRVEKVILDYGTTGHPLYLDRSVADWDVIVPAETAALSSAAAAFTEAADNAIGSDGLREILSPDDRVVIVTSDGTRPVPNAFLIMSIVNHCRLEPKNVTILVGTGSHRAHTKAEMAGFLGEDVVGNYRIICHDATDDDILVSLGRTSSGIPVTINRHYLEAGKKVVLGFIEPHLFAGFSGGPKGVCPAICGLDTIDAFHSYRIIGHPDSDYGKLENNPQQQAARDVVRLAPPDFLINVLLNSSKQITDFYCGDYIEAHRTGCRGAGEVAIVPLEERYPIVITTNSGYPLDQNLYQTVKGISAAALIVEDGGIIFVASECSKGIPDDGNFADIMLSHADIDSIDGMISSEDYHVMDRWQAQKLIMALRKAEVKIFTSLTEAEVETCKMTKVENLQRAISAQVKKLGYRPRIAVMPRGPLTIPVLK